jgi:predicted dehydrogenase
MIRIGVIGLGMMGVTHLGVYLGQRGAKVVAVADPDPDRRAGRVIAAGNIEGQTCGHFDFSQVGQYAEGMALIADPDVDAIDICVATPLHLRYAQAAIESGKHVLVEKPLARTFSEANLLVNLAADTTTIAMPAMCMRFWPGWVWLKEVIAQARFGAVLSASFRRLSARPPGRFYADGAACGGAILDLHIHDTDFVRHCFGDPSAVRSHGYSRGSGEIDHVITSYEYENGPTVVAEGGWAMQPAFPFTMQYTVNFEHATAEFDLSKEEPLRLYEEGNAGVTLELPTSLGYEHEIAYFLECVQAGHKPTIVTLADAAAAIRIVEAEVVSIRTGQSVSLGSAVHPATTRTPALAAVEA